MRSRPVFGSITRTSDVLVQPRSEPMITPDARTVIVASAVLLVRSGSNVAVDTVTVFVKVPSSVVNAVNVIVASAPLARSPRSQSPVVGS